MVHLVRKALYVAGVPNGRVSIETYFNHYAEPPDRDVDQLAARFRGEPVRDADQTFFSR